MLAAVSHPNVQLVWDPCNALVAGEEPYPHGLQAAAPESHRALCMPRDCHMEGHKPVFGPLGTRDVDWKGQIESHCWRMATPVG